MADAGNLPLSDQLLATMRLAAQRTVDLREPFITPRTMLLALLEAPVVGPALAQVISKQKLLAATARSNFGSVRVIEEWLPGEQPPMTRYDTLAFKTPDGRASLWLSKEALKVFLEGAKRVDERYEPRELALGLAAESVLSPGILAAIRVGPGAVYDAIKRIT